LPYVVPNFGLLYRRTAISVVVISFSFFCCCAVAS
jgi:hypothetical protein